MKNFNLDPINDITTSAVNRLQNIRQEMKEQRAAEDEQTIVTLLNTKGYEVDHIDIASISLFLDLSNDGDDFVLIKCDVSIVQGLTSTQYGDEWGSYKTFERNSLTVNQIMIEDGEGYQPYGYPITNDAMIEAIEKEVAAIYDLKGYL